MCAQSSTHTDPLELLTVVQVSELLKLSSSTVKREIAAGRLASVLLGRSRRVPRAAVQAYIEQRGAPHDP